MAIAGSVWLTRYAGSVAATSTASSVSSKPLAIVIERVAGGRSHHPGLAKPAAEHLLETTGAMDEVCRADQGRSHGVLSDAVVDLSPGWILGERRLTLEGDAGVAGQVGGTLAARASSLFGDILGADPYVPDDRFRALGIGVVHDRRRERGREEDLRRSKDRETAGAS